MAQQHGCRAGSSAWRQYPDRMERSIYDGHRRSLGGELQATAGREISIPDCRSGYFWQADRSGHFLGHRRASAFLEDLVVLDTVRILNRWLDPRNLALPGVASNTA